MPPEGHCSALARDVGAASNSSEDSAGFISKRERVEKYFLYFICMQNVHQPSSDMEVEGKQEGTVMFEQLERVESDGEMLPFFQHRS